MTGNGMVLDLASVFEDYRKPFYLIRPVLLLDGTAEDFEYRYVNRAFCRLVGRTQAELVGHRFRDNFVGRGDRMWLDLFVDAAAKKKHVYVDGVCDILGKKMYTEAFHVYPNLCGCLIHTVEEAAEGLEKGAEFRRRANYDSLTGLYNRYYLREHSQELAGDGNLGLVYLDVNGLKNINLARGHQAGDDILRLVAKRLRWLYPDLPLFRVGGDEFVAVAAGQERDDFLAHAQESRLAFSADQLAAVGYQYYENVENLMVCVDQCRTLASAQRRTNP
jgi:diguanylate cyclase (GGDEF)-like protein